MEACIAISGACRLRAAKESTQAPELGAKQEGEQRTNPRWSSNKERGWKTDLPTGIAWESRNLHAVGGSTRPRRRALLVAEAAARAGGTLPVSGPAGELDGQALSHEIGSIFARLVRGYGRGSATYGMLRREVSIEENE